ncbi:MAG: hypothetical protein HFG09_09470 [Oscillibacter sp.]|nr:hypothetical protein [Oscillibacter sp.]
MKKMKKLTALLLTLVMSLALAVPCFAAAPESKNAPIWLKAGETITVDGVSIEFQTGDAAAQAMNAARAARANYYYYKNKHVQGTDYFGAEINCQRSRGEDLQLDLDNSNRCDVVMEMWINGQEILAYCDAGKPSSASFHQDGGMSAAVSWSIYPAGNTGIYMDYYFSAYQY